MKTNAIDWSDEFVKFHREDRRWPSRHPPGATGIMRANHHGIRKRPVENSKRETISSFFNYSLLLCHLRFAGSRYAPCPMLLTTFPLSVISFSAGLYAVGKYLQN